MSDKEICQWIHDRMVGMWGENKNVDYMIRFRKAIDNIQDDPQAVTRLIAAARPVMEEAKHRADYMHDTYALDAPIKLTLTVGELRAIRAALAAFDAKETNVSTRLVEAVADFKRQYPKADVIPLSIIEAALAAFDERGTG